MKTLAFLRRYSRVRAGLLVVGALVTIAIWVRTGPLPAGLLDEPMHPSTVVVDRHGVPLREALSSDQTRGMRLTVATLPPSLVAATLAAEDRRFWQHPGVDPIALMRAMRINLAEGHIVEGGSTISQQVAKLLLNRRSPAPRQRGVGAKIDEALIALRLEHRFTKAELLAMYLNIAAYGNQYVGAERASRGYFGVPAALLTPAQAAFLAGLPQRPSGFNPYRNRDSAIRRQRAVLRRMRAAGSLSSEQLRIALDERLTFAPREAPFAAPHFVEMVLNASGRERPARIETTLDAVLQADVAGIIDSQRDLLRRHGATNVAVVVLDNDHGEWLAWEGSGDYFDAAHGGTINGPTTPRQPGSALKPFTYALAFERGANPATLLADLPSSFPTAESGVVYVPRNYDNRYRGPLLARRALAGSENVPAVALASEIGVPALLRFYQRAGMDTLDKTASYYGLGVTLGNAEVRLDQLVAAYAAFARGGEWIEPTFVRRDGNQVARTQRLVSPRTAFWITDILSDSEAREFVFGRGGSLDLPFPVAVKTGTSQAYHDNWTIGYSTRVTVGVWVGNFDRTPLRNSSGVTGAGPIFNAVMVAAERRLSGSSTEFSHDPILPVPPGLVQRDICALSGERANAWCPVRRREWMPADEPEVPCRWHHLGDGELLTIWPREYQQWARQNGVDEAVHPRRKALAISSTASAVAMPRAPSSSPLTIVSPPAGATYLIDPTLRRDFQTLPLRVVATTGGSIDWSVSGRSLGSADAASAIDWPLAPGEHRIIARDREGHVAETTVTVR
ncbi:MAG TPA: penicillin-binding protein 1C [Vicinamibacterales bacterium]